MKEKKSLQVFFHTLSLEFQQEKTPPQMIEKQFAINQSDFFASRYSLLRYFEYLLKYFQSTLPNAKELKNGSYYQSMNVLHATFALLLPPSIITRDSEPSHLTQQIRILSKYLKQSYVKSLNFINDVSDSRILKLGLSKLSHSAINILF